MLQQTRVETVIPHYIRFLARFPTLRHLARASLEQVLAHWSGLGYYRRARSLHAGARKVLEEHGGEFPRDMERALEIPGVGPYTAAAVLSIAYNIPLPVVDGNVERVLTRLLRIRGKVNSAMAVKKLRALAARAMPEGRASEFNQALMELGAIVCTPSNPDCAACPLAGSCAAHRTGEESRFPERPQQRPFVSITIEVGIIRRGDLCLFERVEEGSFLRGLWLFPFREASDPRPSGPSRTFLGALERALGARIRSSRLVANVRHAITFRRITAEVYLLEPRDFEPSEGKDARRASCGKKFRWARLEDLGRTLPTSSLTLKIARLLG